MRSSRRPLLLAFGAVVICFVATTTFAELRLAGIDLAVRNIAALRLPSIQHLSAARTSLRHLQQALADYVDAVGEGTMPPRGRVDDIRRQLDEELGAYQALPRYGATPAFEGVRHALPPLDEAVARVFARVQEHDFPGAHSRLLYDLAPAAERLDAAILALEEQHVDAVYRLAMQIARVRQRSMLFSFGLDLTSVALAVVAAWLSLRTVAQYTSSLEAHGRLLERRADELEQFAGRVAHDVLSPLSTVSLALGHAEEAAPEDEAVRKMLARGRASVQRVEKIVDGLLAFARAGARPEAGARADFGEVLHGVLDEARELAAEANVEVRTGAMVTAVLACSPGVLASLISNLVRNAIKYMGDQVERRVVVRAQDRGGCVRVEVEDTGPGLPPHFEQSVFQPYVRAPGTSQPGIGLGLATVKRIAQAHGGQVGVRSSPGRGSCFWFELPKA